MLHPKSRFASRTAVETATTIAVSWFNQGHSNFEQVLEELRVLPSKQLVRLSDMCDQRRMRKVTDKLTAEARPHRRNKDSSCKSHEGAAHAAGEF